MGELAFIGLGLNDDKGISLKGLEKAKISDVVFAEFYTSLMPDLDLRRLETLIGKRIHVVSRRDLEEDEGKELLQSAQNGSVAFLVPGDPLIATTHVDLRIRAHRRGIKTSVINGASIVTAVVGLTGLQNYKFGRSVTVPFTETGVIQETPYNVIAQNKKAGLHTLCFLDIRAAEKKYVTVNDGLQILLMLENRARRNIVTGSMLAVGIARAGSEDPTVKTDYVEKLLNYDFGEPPHSLVFPGNLHFMEAEALVTLTGAPERVKETTQ